MGRTTTELDLPMGYVNGLQSEYLTASTARINIGECQSSTNDFDIQVESNIDLDITTSGAGGLDTGSEASSTWYAVHVIAGPGVVSGVFSLSATSPTLPAGYDQSRRIGWVRNDGSSNLVSFSQHGNSNDRTNYYSDIINNHAVLLAGGSVGFATVDCSDHIPSTSTMGYFQNRELGTTPCLLGTVAIALLIVESGVGLQAYLPTTATQTIQYGHLAGGGSTSIYVTAWQESI